MQSSSTLLKKTQVHFKNTEKNSDLLEDNIQAHFGTKSHAKYSSFIMIFIQFSSWV